MSVRLCGHLSAHFDCVCLLTTLLRWTLSAHFGSVCLLTTFPPPFLSHFSKHPRARKMHRSRVQPSFASIAPSTIAVRISLQPARFSFVRGRACIIGTYSLDDSAGIVQTSIIFSEPIPVFAAMCVSVHANLHFFARARPTHQAERSEWICAIRGAVDRAKEKALAVSRTGPVDQVRSKLAIINNSQNFQVNTLEGVCCSIWISWRSRTVICASVEMRRVSSLCCW